MYLFEQTGETKPEEKKKESWQKSVGTFSSKTSLAGLVKRKAPVKDSLISTSSEIKNESGHSRVACHGAETVVVDTVTMPSGSNDITINPVETKPSVSLGLGLLGGYSDSSSDGNDSP